MIRTGRTLAVVAALAALLVTQARSQPPAVAPPSFPTGPALAPLTPAENLMPASFPSSCASCGVPGSACAPPACAPYEDRNGPLLQGDPLLEGPCWAPPGWFAAVEVDPVVPRVGNQLTAPVTTAAGTTQVQLPNADLRWTVSPLFEVGYRFSQGYGELLGSYRFVESAGSGSVPGFDAVGNTGSLSSRLDMNVWDLDYASREFSLGPDWDMKWFAGVRVASIYYDSTANSTLLQEHSSNHFAGAGPHAGLELVRAVEAVPGLSLFGRLDGGLLMGPVHQVFDETIGPGKGVAPSGETDQKETQAVPMVSVKVGLGWTPPEVPNLRLAGGYIFEGWYDVGENVGSGSRGEITVQGVFLRGEWKY
jgi:major outer membrane protein